MASGDVFKITLKMTLDSVECRPGFYLIEGSGGGGLGPTRDAADHVAITLGAGWLTGFVQNLNLVAVQADDVQPAVAASYETNVGTVAGDVADDNPPAPQDSMLVTWQTGIKATIGNFAAHGRMYMPGIYSTGQISGFLTAPLLTAFNNAMQVLYDAYIADGSQYQMHVVSFNPGTNPRTIRAVQPVVNFICRNRVRSQRRRQAGVGI